MEKPMKIAIYGNDHQNYHLETLGKSIASLSKKNVTPAI